MTAATPLDIVPEQKKRRPPGAGWAEKTRNGRYRARLPLPDGSVKPLGVFDTAEAAHRELDAAAYVLAKGDMAVVGGVTLAAYGEKFLKRRDLNGARAIDNDRMRWNTHIASASFASRPMASVQPRDIRDWLESLRRKQTSNVYGPKKLLSPATIRHCRNLLSRAFQEAMEIDELISDNPVAKAKLPPMKATVDEKWTYLLPEEQRTLLECTAIPKSERLIIAVAMGTGLRQGELWNLELVDVHLDDPQPWLWIQYGKPNHGPTKSGVKRRVELFGLALEAMKEWLAMLPSYLTSPPSAKHPTGIVYPNPRKIVFPTQRGRVRRDRKALRFWESHLLAAGIARKVDAKKGKGISFAHRHDGRHVRWHDLRHTCASSLTAGWWGRPWRMEEIARLLGHADIKTTQCYAHLAASVVADAAAATPGLPKPVEPADTELANPARTPPGQAVREGFIKDFAGGVDGTRTRGLRRDRPAL